MHAHKIQNAFAPFSTMHIILYRGQCLFGIAHPKSVSMHAHMTASMHLWCGAALGIMFDHSCSHSFLCYACFAHFSFLSIPDFNCYINGLWIYSIYLHRARLLAPFLSFDWTIDNEGVCTRCAYVKIPFLVCCWWWWSCSKFNGYKFNNKTHQ